MPMKNPPHPGRIIRQDCIEPLGLTITEAAHTLGVTRFRLANLRAAVPANFLSDISNAVRRFGHSSAGGGMVGQT